MIQRIQSLFLLLVVICLGAMFFTPIATVGDTTLTAQGIVTSEGSSVDSFLPFPISAWIIGVILLSLFVLLSFKNRKRQLTLGRLNYLLILGLVVVIFLSISDLMKQIGVSDPNPYHVGAYLPIIALGLHLLANRAIKRDEALVKSLDRLR